MRYETRQSSIMLFKREKHGAPVRRDFRGRYKYKSRGGVLLHHGRSFRAQFAFSDAHASPSLLAHAAGRRSSRRSTPRAASCLLMGKRPTMAAFRRKAAQLQIQLRGKPRTLTGFLLIPPPRSAAARGTMIRCMLLYVQNTTPGSNCQYLFPSLPLFCNRPPKNPHRETPAGAKHRRGVGAGVSPHPFRKEIK